MRSDVFDVETFIRKNVTKRESSLFDNDILSSHDILNREVANKNVLVIGGAGTIGASFIKAILKYPVSKLYVIDTNENGLTELVRDLRSSQGLNLPEIIKTYPINFNDPIFEKIFRQEERFHIVANFAAHKHVRSEKDLFSIEAMINNNVIYAKRLLDLLVEFPPEHFFCVSTDKAANPVNIMGASKKLMENIIMAYSNKLKITTARFANVAFSNGSLLAGFFDRLLKKQPLSCPSDVKRYFVSPSEAGEICLLACVLGESGDIFFPKLSREHDLVGFVSIIEPFLAQFGLALDICQTEEEARIKAANLQSNAYPVYLFRSETSGEKLYEEFYTDVEQPNMNLYNSLGVIKIKKRKSMEEVKVVVKQIEGFFKHSNSQKASLIELLNTMLPDFTHIETGLNLDQKM